ncbi:MAG: phage minor head protein, partial [Pseudomonadota bacterium]
MRVDLAPVPPREAIAYLRSKGLAPPGQRFDWRDHWREEHARNFVVAKAMQDDVLRALQDELVDALENGRPLADFQRTASEKMKAFGWWGRGLQEDPLTGQLEEVQLGSRHRLRVIFDTNMRTAYAAGRWARIQRTKAAFPYLEYVQIERDTKRLEHEPFDGLILPVDHPIWQKIMPPNGFFCGCTVLQTNDRKLAREGKQVSPEPDFDMESFTNPRTGERSTFPVGIHPGFDSSPGHTWMDLSARHEAVTGHLSAAFRALDRGYVDQLLRMVQRDGTEALVAYDLDADPLEAEVDVNFAGAAASVAPTPEMRRAFEDPDRRT